jgi:ribosomal protein S6E (S10)
MARPCSGPKATVEQDGEASKLKELAMHTHQKSSDTVATIGLDIGKNTFHLVGLDRRGAIVMRVKVSRNQLVRRLVNLPPCLIGLEAGARSHHIARQIELNRSAVERADSDSYPRGKSS